MWNMVADSSAPRTRKSFVVALKKCVFYCLVKFVGRCCLGLCFGLNILLYSITAWQLIFNIWLNFYRLCCPTCCYSTFLFSMLLVSAWANLSLRTSYLLKTQKKWKCQKEFWNTASKFSLQIKILFDAQYQHLISAERETKSYFCIWKQKGHVMCNCVCIVM